MLLRRAISSASIFLLSALLFSQTTSGLGEKLVLDLTKVPPSDRRSIGVPGGYAGGLSNGIPLGVLGRHYDLPAKLNLKTIGPVNGNKRILTLEIVNSGGAALQIPACSNPYTAFTTGATNRRSLNIGLLFHSPGKGGDSSEVAEVTFGSNSVQKCLISLNPGNTLTVVMEAEFPKKMLERAGDVKDESFMRAFIEEWKFEDSRFVIDQQSQRVESDAISIKP
jgi:hypothetical protein